MLTKKQKTLPPKLQEKIIASKKKANGKKKPNGMMKKPNGMKKKKGK